MLYHKVFFIAMNVPEITQNSTIEQITLKRVPKKLGFMEKIAKACECTKASVLKFFTKTVPSSSHNRESDKLKSGFDRNFQGTEPDDQSFNDLHSVCTYDQQTRDHYDSDDHIEGSPARLVDQDIEDEEQDDYEGEDEEEYAGSPESPGSDQIEAQADLDARDYEIEQHHMDIIRARRSLVDLFMFHGNQQIQFSRDEDDHSNQTTQADRIASAKDKEIKMQQMIYDNIQKRNKRKTVDQLDVYNLDQPKIGMTSDEGLPQRVIDSIITNTFYKCNMLTNDPSKLECSICCVEYKDGDQIKILQCLHTHHKDCVDRWFTKKSTCPDCKFNMRSINVRQLY